MVIVSELFIIYLLLISVAYSFLMMLLTDYFINRILSVVVGGNQLPLGGGRSLVNS